MTVQPAMGNILICAYPAFHVRKGKIQSPKSLVSFEHQTMEKVEKSSLLDVTYHRQKLLEVTALNICLRKPVLS